MIRELRIKNFAIIEELEIVFHPGLNVLTGETGAGKSIIVGALSLLLGRRVGDEVIRTGADKAEVEALFEEDGEEIILRREIYPEGRSRAFYQGRGVPISFLKEIGPSLFEIHSQLEHGWILKESNQLEAIDRYGGKVIETLLDEYGKLYEEYIALVDKLKELEINRDELRRKKEEISFYLQELEKASLRVGEEEELLEKRERLLNIEELKSSIKEALKLLEGEAWGGGILDRLGELRKLLERVTKYERELSHFPEEVNSFLLSLKDLSFALSKRLEFLDLEGESLEDIEDRLSLIRKLKRKHGVSDIKGLLELASQWRESLKDLGDVEDKVKVLRGKAEELLSSLRLLGDRISKERKKYALLLEEEVKKVLEKLAMGNIAFKVQFDKDELGPKGFDRVKFLMAPSLEDELKRIGEIASGGEISRLSFALKCAISKSYGVTTLIFDEIDVGIGGDVANMLGEEIKKLSKSRQVICITHLASIASKADYHYFVDKVMEGGRVKSKVKLLEGDERLREIARMLSGRVSEVALIHAKELLEGGKP